MRYAYRSALLLAATLAQPAAVTAPLAAQAPAPALKAGAAKVDITPALADLPKPFDTIHDRLSARAVVLDDGRTRAVIVTLDVGMIADSVYFDLKRRIAVEAKAPVENVVIAVTHTHNAVRLDPNPVGVIIPGSAKVAQDSAAGAVLAVRQAVAALRPARAGYAQGIANLVGRRERGASPNGQSAPGGAPQANGGGEVDRALGVFKVEDQAGQPIAFLVNSTLEPTLAFPRGHDISADVAGAAADAIEARYASKPVLLYTTGAVGGGTLYSSRPNGKTPPADAYRLVDAVGTLFAEDVLATAGSIRTSDRLPIAGAMRTITCPGKKTTPLNTPTSCSDAPGATLPPCVFKDADAPAANLYTAALKLGDLTLVQADANVTGNVWRQVRGTAPADTLFVALNYGPVHYVVEDAAYPGNSYQVTASTAKRGCVASGFTDAALDMIRAPQRRPS